jgi:hypothetical protein
MNLDPTHIQLGIAAASILGSGVVSAIVSHAFTSRRAMRDVKRSKAEALYIAVHGYCNLIAAQNIVWPRVMRGELTYDKALDINSEGRRERDYLHHENAEMLISLYFPSLEKEWSCILKVRDRINEIRSVFKEEYCARGPSDRFLKAFLDAMHSLGPAESEFKVRLAKIVKRI